MPFIFRGIAFPFRISPTTGGVALSEADDANKVQLFRESLEQIILTSLGERVIEKGFGTDIMARVFDSNDDELQQVLHYTIVKAVGTWEERVSLNSVTFAYGDQDGDDNIEEGRLRIRVNYTVNRTKLDDEFVLTL